MTNDFKALIQSIMTFLSFEQNSWAKYLFDIIKE